MKIYIAGRYNLLNELKLESQKYIDAGHSITSRWLDNQEEGKSWDAVADMDIQDVHSADACVLYTEPYGTPVSGGGRHVEFGYALGAGKIVVVVGPHENIFHWHPSVVVFPKTEYAIKYLNGMKKNG
jgi:hypothetical protein